MSRSVIIALQSCIATSYPHADLREKGVVTVEHFEVHFDKVNFHIM